jgi:hypothetical protein
MKLCGALVLLAAGTAAADPLRAVKEPEFGGICAIRADDRLVCEKADDLPWKTLPVRDIVLSYNPLVVGTDGTLARVRRGPEAKLEPIALGFKAAAAGQVGQHKLCVAGEHGELACQKFDPDTDRAFDALPVAAKIVDVAFSHEQMWALDERGGLWCAGGSSCGRAYTASGGRPGPLLGLAARWPLPTAMPADAPLFHVADGVARMLATGGSPCFELTSRADELVCVSASKGAYTIPTPQADEVVTAGVMLCARTGERITCQIPGTRYVEPVTMTITAKGAVKMFGGSEKLCVENGRGELACTQLRNPLADPTPVVWATRP